MKTPVIIPAYNEELRLGYTLKALPSQYVEPIVAVNGTTDATVQVAEKYGATVLEIPEQGKMLAIQSALSSLGERALLPCLILDADARPLFSKAWHEHMIRLLAASEVPTVVGEPVWYTGHSTGEAVLRSLYRAGRTAIRANNGKTDRAIQLGPNMAIGIKDRQVLDKVMRIPNYWPGEDRALAGTIVEEGGQYIDTVDPFAVVLNPTSISAISLPDRLRLGKQGSLRIVAQRYVERGPQGAASFD